MPTVLDMPTQLFGVNPIARYVAGDDVDLGAGTWDGFGFGQQLTEAGANGSLTRAAGPFGCATPKDGAIDFSGSTDKYFAGTSATEGNISTDEDLLLLIFGKLTGVSKYVVSKRDNAAPNNGWSFSLGGSGAGSWIIDGALGAAGPSIASVKLDQYAMYLGAIDRSVASTNGMRMWVDAVRDVAGADPTGAGDCDTTLPFAINALGAGVVPGNHEIALAAYWQGVDMLSMASLSEMDDLARYLYHDCLGGNLNR